MDYGYTFLRGPLVPQAGTQKTIGEMDMDELRGYLCAKTLGNPKTCISCNGFKGCQVGQRALVLMGQYRKVWDEQSGSEEPAPKQAGPETTAQASKPGTQTDKDNFRAACESGNARRWLYERGYSEATAQEKLVYWVKHYPDITQEYGKKRILQKLRKVIVTSMKIGTEEQNGTFTVAPQAAGLPHTGAAETKVEEIDKSAEAPERPEKPQENVRKHLWPAEALESYHRKREAAVRKRCMEALASGDPEAHMMSQGITRKAARQNLRRWQEKFPDLFFEEIEPEEKAPAPEPDSIIVQTEDEISLSDFLKQYGVPLSETPEPVVEPKDVPEENPNRKLAQLMEQETKLLVQVADLQEQIWKIRGERRAIERKFSH